MSQEAHAGQQQTSAGGMHASTNGNRESTTDQPFSKRLTMFENISQQSSVSSPVSPSGSSPVVRYPLAGMTELKGSRSNPMLAAASSSASERTTITTRTIRSSVRDGLTDDRASGRPKPPPRLNSSLVPNEPKINVSVHIPDRPATPPRRPPLDQTTPTPPRKPPPEITLSHASVPEQSFPVNSPNASVLGQPFPVNSHHSSVPGQSLSANSPQSSAPRQSFPSEQIFNMPLILSQPCDIQKSPSSQTSLGLSSPVAPPKPPRTISCADNICTPRVRRSPSANVYEYLSDAHSKISFPATRFDFVSQSKPTPSRVVSRDKELRAVPEDDVIQTNVSSYVIQTHLPRESSSTLPKRTSPHSQAGATVAATESGRFVKERVGNARKDPREQWCVDSWDNKFIRAPSSLASARGSSTASTKESFVSKKRLNNPSYIYTTVRRNDDIIGGVARPNDDVIGGVAARPLARHRSNENILEFKTTTSEQLKTTTSENGRRRRMDYVSVEAPARINATETRGQAFESRGQVAGPRGHAAEPRDHGQAIEPKGQMLEPRGQVVVPKSRGQAEPRGQTLEHRGEALVSRGQGQQSIYYDPHYFMPSASDNVKFDVAGYAIPSTGLDYMKSQVCLSP